MGVEIYNAMPLPEANFQPRRIPVPGRNEPCLCGSGEKYKHCCLPLAGFLDLSNHNMLRYVLDSLPKKCFTELPASRVDAIAVYDTACQWHGEGDIERARALLEPWFVGHSPLAGKLEPLFDQLMDCYLIRGDERKRDRLVAEVIKRGDRELRAAALQRRSTMLADRGDIEQAWESFREAQRVDPDNPSHATLELTLLVSRGEIERARERARFWIARLERLRDPALADLIAFVREIQADPREAMANIDRQRIPGLDRLKALLAQAPVPAAHCRVTDQGDAGRVLAPEEDLAGIEARWGKVFPQTKPSLTGIQHEFAGMWDAPELWLDFLGKHPLAWHSFDVLDDLVMAVDALHTMGADATVLEPLLARGAALLATNLKAAVPGNGTLQWAWQENRPALRLLAHLAFRALGGMDRGASSERSIEFAELLMALNPYDNHGMRNGLTRAYLAHGWPDKVIALTDRYPDDFCAPTLNRILALVRLDRRGDALTALRDAARDHRGAIEMLLADAPKRPPVNSAYGITVGGKEEAWEYRTAHRELWARDGALDWLGAAWRDLRKGMRGRG